MCRRTSSGPSSLVFCACASGGKHLQFYTALGGEGGSLEAALAYSNVVFASTWLVST